MVRCSVILHAIQLSEQYAITIPEGASAYAPAALARQDPRVYACLRVFEANRTTKGEHPIQHFHGIRSGGDEGLGDCKPSVDCNSGLNCCLA